MHKSLATKSTWGVSTGHALNHPALYLDGKAEGALSADNQIAGTYLHGLFDHAESAQAWLTWAGFNAELIKFDYAEIREASLNRLADCLEQHLDWEKLKPLLS